jgi:mono/diheme cytochrome c family protein
VKRLKEFVTVVLRWAVAFISKKRAISAIAIGLLTLFIAFSALIGMPPIGYVLILAGIAGPTVWYVLRAERREESGEGRLTARRFLAVVVMATLGTFLVIQLVPYGKSHSNPPTTGEPQWANAETRDLMVRACFGCHSNEVTYPAYASVAPISWVVQSHVEEGRNRVNYSEFAQHPRGAHETLRVIENGSMPPSYYTMFGRHPEAKLTKEELATLIAGIKATPGLSGRGR